MKLKQLFIIIAFSVFANATFSQSFCDNSSYNIPGSTSLCVPITVSGVGAIDGSYGLEEVCIDLDIGYISDVYITLESPDGTIHYLTYDDGFTEAASGLSVTCFNSGSSTPIWTGTSPYNGQYQPVTHLSAFNNHQDADGVWNLCIDNGNSWDDATLNSVCITFASNPPAACGASAGNTLTEAPLICDFNGYCGTTANYFTIDDIPDADFCGALNNNSWVEFVPSATDVEIAVSVSDCENSDGVQFGVYDYDGVNFTEIYCDNQVFPGAYDMTFNGLTVGDSYYLMIDGYAGDMCNYSFSVDGSSGVSVVEIDQGDEMEICPGDDVNLSVPDLPNVVYDWEWPTGTDNGTNVNIAAATPPFDVTVTATGACNVIMDTISIVQGTTCCTVDAGADVDVCEGEMVTLSATGSGVSYDWTGGVTQSVPFIPVSSGTYTVSMDDGAGCTATDDVYVQVLTNPVAEAGADMSITCDNPEINLDASASSSGAEYTYLWTTTDGNIVSGDASLSPLVNYPGTYVLIVTNSLNSCVSQDQTSVINLSIQPNVSAGDDMELTCATPNVYLDGTGSDSGPNIEYLWTTADGNILSGANTVNPQVDQAGTYTLTVTNTSTGCTAHDDCLITENFIYPNPILGNDTTICVYNSPLTLDPETDPTYSYLWSEGSNGSNLQVVSSGVYGVTVSNGSCSAQDEISVTVAPAPSLDLGSDLDVCDYDAPVTLDASAGLTYAWSSGEDTQTINANISGNYSVVVTDVNGCTASDNVNITINNAPSIDLGSNQTLCDYDIPVILDAGAGFTYAWSTGEDTQTVNADLSGNYAVVITDANGCTASDNVDVTVNTSPTVDLGGDQTICDYDNLMLDAGAGMANYAWSTGENSQTVTIDTEDDYFVTVTASNGCTASDEMHLNIETSPVPNLGDDIVVCAYDAPVLLNPGTSAVYNYSWSEGSTESTINVLSSGTYEVTVSAGSCSAIDQIEVTINPAPLVDLGDDQTLCAYNVPITLDAGGAMADYNWSDGSDLQTLEISSSDTYTVTVTDGNGCTASSSMSLIVNPIPSIELGGNQSVCDYDVPVVLDAGAGFTYAWSTGEDTQTVNANVSGNYSVVVTDANGCTASDNVDVTINPAPSLDLGVDQTVCESELPININAGVFASYLWSTGDENQVLSVNASGDYSLTVTDVNGCTTNDEISIAVNELVTPLFDAYGPYCQNESADVLSSTSNNGLSGNWSPAIIETSSPGNFEHVFTPSSGQCAEELSINIEVVESVNPEFSLTNTYCQNDEAFDLPLTSNNGIVGTWTPSAIDTESLGVQSYQFTPTNPSDCALLYNESITVNAYPELSIWMSDTVTNSGESIEILVSGADVYAWTPADELSCTDCSDPLFLVEENFNSDQNYVFHLTASQNACSVEDSIQITVNEMLPLVIPQGFSPNGDGVGDYWTIQGLDRYPNCEMLVYNRWGHLVYQANPYDNQWDGKNFNAEPLKSGTYYYQLNLNDNSSTSYAGFVYVNN
jgi:gliding motility-associated-like protein